MTGLANTAWAMARLLAEPEACAAFLFLPSVQLKLLPGTRAGKKAACTDLSYRRVDFCSDLTLVVHRLGSKFCVVMCCTRQLRSKQCASIPYVSATIEWCAHKESIAKEVGRNARVPSSHASACCHKKQFDNAESGFHATGLGKHWLGLCQPCTVPFSELFRTLAHRLSPELRLQHHAMLCFSA